MEIERLEGMITDVRKLLIMICLLVAVQTAVTLYPALLTLARVEPPGFAYTIESPEDKDLASTMTELGSYGWELVTARRAVSDGEPSYEMIFKRAKR